MKRRQFLIQAAVLAALATPVWAASPSDQIVSQLRSIGYTEVTVQRTLLGRTRIVAIGAKGRREIILDPRTGEILRDFTQWTGNSSDRGAGLIDTGDGSGSGDDDGDEDDGDDDSDDSGDDDSDDDDSDDSDSDDDGED